ncbi:putative membrane protein, partial [Escherichia coli 95.0183]
MKQFHGLHLLV